MKFRRLAAILLAIAGSITFGAGKSQAEHRGERVTFVQLTDAHLFDEGWKLPLADALRLAAENWAAFDWSIDKINGMVDAGKRIDFVVYTGDLGLQNVDFSGSKTCSTTPVSVEPGLPPIPEETAVRDFAAELERLTVRTIYFVSGNNDPVDEDARDGRFDCFLADLVGQTRHGAGSLTIQKLEPGKAVFVNGIALLGINSASFKKAGNYQAVCSQKASEYPATRRQDACPEEEMNELEAQLSPGTPSLLFTHVPDLRDPYRQGPAWDIPADVRERWESEVARANVIGVFAGHLHDSDRSLYGTNTGTRRLALSRDVAEKLYVAPPLAIKNQTGKAVTARGLMVVTAASCGISEMRVLWFDDERLSAWLQSPAWQ